jgi:hypothetical protein
MPEHIIVLKTPLPLADDKKITEIKLTEPNAAAMKGLSRYEILTMVDDAHKKLLPRISYPQITPNLFNQMSLKDSQKVMNVVISFFVDTEEDEYPIA